MALHIRTNTSVRHNYDWEISDGVAVFQADGTRPSEVRLIIDQDSDDVGFNMSEITNFLGTSTDSPWLGDSEMNRPITVTTRTEGFDNTIDIDYDFSNVRGNAHGKRAGTTLGYEIFHISLQCNVIEQRVGNWLVNIDTINQESDAAGHQIFFDLSGAQDATEGNDVTVGREIDDVQTSSLTIRHVEPVVYNSKHGDFDIRVRPADEIREDNNFNHYPFGVICGNGTLTTHGPYALSWVFTGANGRRFDNDVMEPVTLRGETATRPARFQFVTDNTINFYDNFCHFQKINGSAVVSTSNVLPRSQQFALTTPAVDVSYVEDNSNNDELDELTGSNIKSVPSITPIALEAENGSGDQTNFEAARYILANTDDTVSAEITNIVLSNYTTERIALDTLNEDFNDSTAGFAVNGYKNIVLRNTRGDLRVFSTGFTSRLSAGVQVFLTRLAKIEHTDNDGNATTGWFARRRNSAFNNLHVDTGSGNDTNWDRRNRRIINADNEWWGIERDSDLYIDLTWAQVASLTDSEERRFPNIDAVDSVGATLNEYTGTYDVWAGTNAYTDVQTIDITGELNADTTGALAGTNREIDFVGDPEWAWSDSEFDKFIITHDLQTLIIDSDTTVSADSILNFAGHLVNREMTRAMMVNNEYAFADSEGLYQERIDYLHDTLGASNLMNADGDSTITNPFSAFKTWNYDPVSKFATVAFAIELPRSSRITKGPLVDRLTIQRGNGEFGARSQIRVFEDSDKDITIEDTSNNIASDLVTVDFRQPFININTNASRISVYQSDGTQVYTYEAPGDEETRSLISSAVNSRLEMTSLDADGNTNFNRGEKLYVVLSRRGYKRDIIEIDTEDAYTGFTNGINNAGVLEVTHFLNREVQQATVRGNVQTTGTDSDGTYFDVNRDVIFVDSEVPDRRVLHILFAGSLNSIETNWVINTALNTLTGHRALFWNYIRNRDETIFTDDFDLARNPSINRNRTAIFSDAHRGVRIGPIADEDHPSVGYTARDVFMNNVSIYSIDSASAIALDNLRIQRFNDNGRFGVHRGARLTASSAAINAAFIEYGVVQGNDLEDVRDIILPLY